MPGGGGGSFPRARSGGSGRRGVGAVNAVVFGEVGREPDRDVKAKWLGWAVAAAVVCVAR